MIYLQLFLGFLKVGLFSFGGAYGAIPLIRDVVISYEWLNDEMLSYMIAVSESTPGPIMVNLATYAGSSQAGLPGALIATFTVILPSFLIILLIMALLETALRNPWIQAVIQGLKPCITGIILATGVYMIVENCTADTRGSALNIRAAVLTLLLTVLYFGAKKVLKNGLSPILLILLSAAAGILIYGI